MRVLRIAALALVATTAVSVVAAGRAAAQETPSDSALTVGHFFDARSGQQSPDLTRRIGRSSTPAAGSTRSRTGTSQRSGSCAPMARTTGCSPKSNPTPAMVSRTGTRIAYLADGDPKGAQIYMRSGRRANRAPRRAPHLTESPSDIKMVARREVDRLHQLRPQAGRLGDRHAQKPPDSARTGPWPRASSNRCTSRKGRRGFQDAPAPATSSSSRSTADPARQLTSGDWNVGARLDGLSMRHGHVGLDARWQDDHRPKGSMIRKATTASRSPISTRSMSPSRHHPHALTAEHGYWRSPSVSPDGRHVAYIGFPTTEQTNRTSNIYVMDIDSSHAHPAHRHVRSRRRLAPLSARRHRRVLRGRGPRVEQHSTSRQQAGGRPDSAPLPPVPMVVIARLDLQHRHRRHHARHRPASAGGRPPRSACENHGGRSSSPHVSEAAPLPHPPRRPRGDQLPRRAAAPIQGWVIKPPGFDPSKRSTRSSWRSTADRTRNTMSRSTSCIRTSRPITTSSSS